MIINDNLPALNAFNALQTNTTAMNTALNDLTTGKRVNSAADDPSGYTISEAMIASINGDNTANTNSQNAVSLIQTASGGLEQVQGILQRMNELAVESANSTETPADQLSLQQEYTQLSKEITQIVQTTQFNGMNLLSGKFAAANSISIQVGSQSGQTMTFSIKSMALSGLKLTGVASISTAALASKAMSQISVAINNLSNQDSLLGASQNRLTYIESNLTSQAQNLTAANATIVDVDMAAEMTAYTQANVLTQAATSMLAQAQQEPTMVLKLLG